MKDIGRLRVASPCTIPWERMTGDDRIRFCDSCHLHVYNFAELTRTEVETLLRTTEGRVCGRLYRRSDGTVITRDCPVGLRAIRRRAAKFAGAVFAGIVSLCSAVVGQKQALKDQSCRQQVKLESKLAQLAADRSSLAGVVLDQNGAVIVRAKITIIEPKSKENYVVESNDEGRFLSANLPAGTYDVVIEANGFKRLKITQVKLAGGQVLSATVTLLVSADVTVGIIGESPLIGTSIPGTIIISGELLRKLPIH